MALTADVDSGDVLIRLLYGDVDEAGAAYFEALFAENGDGWSQWHALVADKITAKRATGGSGSRIFGDAHSGCEHAAVDG